MAQMNEKAQPEADWLLDYLDNALEDLAETVACWDELDRNERIDFWAEWPFTQDKLAMLDGLADDGLLSAPQEARF